MLVIADLCKCEYTDHGHCGILDTDGDVDNDSTLELLCRIALTYAHAGVDVVAPSDMMDGRVARSAPRSTRRAHTGVAIMAYSAKYASAFYGPFREAAGSTPSSATAAPIRWTRPTHARRCARSRSTSPRAPTSS